MGLTCSRLHVGHFLILHDSRKIRNFDMTKFITGVSYRHFLTTAYLRIVGRSRREAERHAKRVGTTLLENLPEMAEVLPARFKGTPAEPAFEIPILIGACEQPAKACLAGLVLQGSV